MTVWRHALWGVWGSLVLAVALQSCATSGSHTTPIAPAQKAYEVGWPIGRLERRIPAG